MSPQTRPFILDPLFTGIQRIPGVGPRIGKALERLTGPKVFDVLSHLPVGLIDRREIKAIGQTHPGETATLIVTVQSHQKPRGKGKPYRVIVTDKAGDTMPLIFFRAWDSTIQKNYPLDQEIIISGKIEFYQTLPQMPHPDKVAPLTKKDQVTIVEPIYPLTQGVSNTLINKCVAYGLERLPNLSEWLNETFKTQEQWPDWKAALLRVHHPQSEQDLLTNDKARQRLAYDELLASQLTLSLLRHRERNQAGQSLRDKKGLKEKARAALPFSLTAGQEEAIQDISKDMEGSQRMLRLLQGDVGSGKTAVAYIAMAHAVGAGKQAALMAPTEVLARQHGNTLIPLCKKDGLTCAVLTGRDKGTKREAILNDLANGTIDILIGTHALFQKDVDFKDLGLAIIDEQHRFGVYQRLMLTDKGQHVDVLVMTATPIPRTLTLTVYGDMDVSRLTEKPAGRQPIDTRAMSIEKIPDLAAGLKRKIADGERIFWVCPLVEESGKIDLAAAIDRHKVLSKHFQDRVGLVHGKMKGDEKDAQMLAFKEGEVDILVATTVIEVGVDVPEATVMVIEHAERFGLSQLHQLRGRVGRGDKPASCLLLYGSPLSDTAKKRIQTLRETEDGFKIAEIDLELRGAGELLGTRQSGLPNFKFADLSAHQHLIRAAHDDARLIINKDPLLKSERGQALKTLLYLYEMDEGVRLLSSG